MGGKSAPATPPDYVGQAQATAAGNLNAARAQTQANRINQVTPYGTIKYTQGNGQFDQAGYDAAVNKYQSQQRQLQQNAGLQEYYGKTGQLLSAPDRNSFMQNPDQWSSEIQLSDTGQQLLDAQNRTSLGMAGLQDQAMQRLADSSAQPFDTSGLIDINDQTGMGAWDKYSNLLMQRLNPDLDTQQAALDTKLANQGLTQGSEGWGTQQQQFGKQRNDANVAAQLAGAQIQNQFFNQAIAGNQATLGQRAYIRSIPLNELNALRSGAQVQNPTFSTPGQQGQTAGPDLMGASNSAYGANQNAINAQNAQTSSNTQAGVGLASTAVMAAAMY